LTKDEIIAFLKEKKEFLKNEFFVDKIGLFGSYARDDATAQSDIDFIIISSKKDFYNRYRLKEFLKEHLKRDIDIGYLDSLRSYIKREIEKEIIYV